MGWKRSTTAALVLSCFLQSLGGRTLGAAIGSTLSQQSFIPCPNLHSRSIASALAPLFSSCCQKIDPGGAYSSDEEAMRKLAKMDGSHLTLRAALAADRLEDFVRQEQELGIELGRGSDFERALALFLVQCSVRQDRHHGPQAHAPRGDLVAIPDA